MWPLRYLLLVVPALGCHVVERAEKCGELAALVQAASPEIASTQLEESPAPKVLRKKARLYGQLAEKVKKVALDQKEVGEERDTLVMHLQNLERHLLEAAAAVDAEAAFQKRQEQMRQQHEKVLAQKAEDAETGSSKSAPPAAPSGPTPAKSPDTKVSQRISGFVPPGIRKSAPNGPSHPTTPRRMTANSRRYERAKHAAETIGRAVQTSTRHLETACR